MVDVDGVLSKYRVSLLDEFSFCAPDGESIVPKQKKARACLALLLTEPNMHRRREWMARMLWPDVTTQKSYTSLRQTLSNIRKSFGIKHKFLLGSDKLSIWLTKQYISLDSLNIKPGDDAVESLVERYLDSFEFTSDSFHDWVVTARATYYKHLTTLISKESSQIQTKPVTDIVIDTITLRINRPKIACQWDTAPVLANFIVDLTSQLVSEFYDVKIIDYRQFFTGKNSSFSDLELTVNIFGDKKNISIAMNVTANKAHTVIANELVTTNTKDLAHLNMPAISSLINKTVEKIKRSAGSLLGNSRSHLFGFEAINAFFDLDQNRLGTIESHLLSDAESYDSVTRLALLAYLRSFGIGENILLSEQKYIDSLKQGSSKIYRNLPFNSISLACLGHHESYVERNLEQGKTLLKAALEVNQHQAFVWDHYALNRLYAGDYQEAVTASGNAIRLGVFSPLLFSYETTMGMVHAMKGDCHSAIKFCERALARQPRFLAARRFLTIALAETHQMERAAQSFIELTHFDPEMSTDSGVRSRIFSTDQRRLEWAVLNLSKARNYATNQLEWRI